MAWNEVINLIAAIVIAAPVSIVIAQLLKQSHWPDGANAALAGIVCVVVGIAQTWISGDLIGLIDKWGSLTANDVILWCAPVWAAAQVEYHAFFAEFPFMEKLGLWPRGK